MKHRYELIVFDWDGTLMDSAAKIVRCFQAAAADVGLADPGAAAIRNIIGLGLSEALHALLPGADPGLHQALAARYREHFLDLDRTEMLLFPGVPQGLGALVEAGYLLAVATGKARRGLDRALADSGVQHYFATTRCADESASKPHPQMLEDILTLTGVAREHALMVGDTVYDLAMARNAGMDGAAVTYGVHERDRLLAERPVACMDSFPEVHAWLR